MVTWFLSGATEVLQLPLYQLHQPFYVPRVPYIPAIKLPLQYLPDSLLPSAILILLKLICATLPKQVLRISFMFGMLHWPEAMATGPTRPFPITEAVIM